jgi:glyoxylase I family protein
MPCSPPTHCRSWRANGKSERHRWSVLPARDAEGLARWYQEHLGVTGGPSSYEEQLWHQEAGSTAFAPFPEDTEYFGNPAKVWMINFPRAILSSCGSLRAATHLCEPPPPPPPELAPLDPPPPLEPL